MTDWTRPTFVYKHYSTTGELLYIGCSVDPFARLSTHKSSPTCTWFGAIARMGVIGPFAYRTALDLERKLIEHHNPPHNIQHTPRKRHGAPWSRYPKPTEEQLAEWLADTEWDWMAGLTPKSRSIQLRKQARRTA